MNRHFGKLRHWFRIGVFLTIAFLFGLTLPAGVQADPNPDHSLLMMNALTAPTMKTIPPGAGGSTTLSVRGNVPVGNQPLRTENEPTTAANPENGNFVIAGNHDFPVGGVNRCAVYRSTNGGQSFTFIQHMPQLTPGSSCSDPVITYSPNGSTAYYSYMDIKSGGFDILVSMSINNGLTWSLPVVALDGMPAFDYDKNWVGTHLSADEDDQDNWVYVTATRFDNFAPFACHIAFTRSSNFGVTWSAPVLLDSSPGNCTATRVVQGSRPEGGKGNRVLVAWYTANTDGWLIGTFSIRTRFSANNGATFAPIVVAVTDSFELPFFLGPFNCYHRWWGGMFPDVEIDEEGRAHIGYTHDPVGQVQINSGPNAEDGNIRYITSKKAPYSTWSAPETVNDDGKVRAQGYVAIEPGGDDDDGGVSALWEDHRLSGDLLVPAPFPANCNVNQQNLIYDQFYATRGGDDDDDDNDNGGWSKNRRITTASSLSDFVFIGDYVDLTLLDDDDDDALFFGIWTDRRDKVSVFDLEDDTRGQRIDNDDD